LAIGGDNHIAKRGANVVKSIFQGDKMPAKKTHPKPGAKKGRTSKSDLIRSLPGTLTASEVVAKAKAASVKLSTQLVYAVRRRGRKTRSASAPTTRVAPAKANSKAAFVRRLPVSTPAKEVVKQAKANGIKIGVSYVYNIRGAAKMAAKRKRAATKSPVPSSATNGGSWELSRHAENLLRAVAAEIGLGRAIEVLQSERDRVHAVVRE
jgi:hypothetical protein